MGVERLKKGGKITIVMKSPTRATLSNNGYLPTEKLHLEVPTPIIHTFSELQG